MVRAVVDVVEVEGGILGVVKGAWVTVVVVRVVVVVVLVVLGGVMRFTGVAVRFVGLVVATGLFGFVGLGEDTGGGWWVPFDGGGTCDRVTSLPIPGRFVGGCTLLSITWP